MRISRDSAVAAAFCYASLVNGQAINPISKPDPSAPHVDLGYAKFQGYTNKTIGINYFRGIQYAADPTNNLRWRKPVPIESSGNLTSSTTYNATIIGPACYQSIPLSIYQPYAPGSFEYQPQGQSENCLTVDVLVPSMPQSKKLPVLVQIHGGGYTEGSAQSYPGDGLVHASKGGLIYVSMQYRLGLFGFLSGSEIARDGVLNAGLLDQRAALEWVQRHIATFGGDPDRVTIWGGSAGGGSVTMQLIAYGAQDKPPFTAAIAEYPWWQPLLNASEQANQYDTALLLSGCSNTSCLRALSAKKLHYLNQAVQNASYPSPGVGFGVFDYGPVVDGTFVPMLPGLAFQLGRFHDVPLLVDHDAYEGVIFSNSSITNQVQETTDAQYLFSFAKRAFFSRLYQLYPRSNYNSTFYQRSAWFGDFIINCPTYFMAYNAVERNTNTSAVFKLTFAAGTQLHGATQPFVSSNTIGFPSANNQTLATIMSSYWISFAVTKDPNPLRASNAPYWPSYVSNGNGTIANGESVGFDTLAVTYTTISPQPDKDANEKCEFFGNNGYALRN